MLRAGAAFALAAGLAVGVLGLTLVPGAAASASLGSVPAEVSAYVTDGPMIARLNDVYGPNASGTSGITFDDTTKPGPISRVYEWTAARLANHATDHPVQLTNNWVVPVTVSGKSVGLATIWINPQTVAPELADFAPSSALGTALTKVPEKAALVRDPATGAWLALADGTVTPLVAGSSGLSTPAPVSSLELSPAAAAAPTAAGPNTGLMLAIGIIALIVIVIVIALLLPRRRGAKPQLEAAAASAGDAAPPAMEPTPAQAATPKPAGPRPSGRTPTTSGAAKPASSKPSASRPADSKPAASKPRASQPPAPQVPTSRRPASKPSAPKQPAPKQPPRARASKPPVDPDPDSDS